MNVAERRYSTREREALAFVFALWKFRLHLLSSEPFKPLTDHQALRSAFAKKDVHGRLARRLDFLVEYDFHIEYQSDPSNKAADFLSRTLLAEKGSVNGDEGDPLCLITSGDGKGDLSQDLEPTLRDVARHLAGFALVTADKAERASFRRRYAKHVLWEGCLYLRVKNILVFVLSIKDRLQA